MANISDTRSSAHSGETPQRHHGSADLAAERVIRERAAQHLANMSRMRPHALAKRAAKSVLMAACSRWPLSQAITWRGSRSSGGVALTFDDGPDPQYTPRVLECLADHGLVATFFVLGNRAEKLPDLVRSIAAAGHEIGIHGYDHTSDALARQAMRTATVLNNLGVQTRLFRPPHGALTRDELWMRMNRYRTILWSFDCVDSLRFEANDHRSIDYDSIDAGDIVLMHDDNPRCLEDLEPIISSLGRHALDPMSVSDLLSRR